MRSASTIPELARRVAKDLRAGRITLAQVLGLSCDELDALAAVGHQRAARGQYVEAADIFALILKYTPLTAKYWMAWASVQMQRGEHLLALLGYEVAQLLDGKRHAAIATRQEQCMTVLQRGNCTTLN